MHLRGRVKELHEKQEEGKPAKTRGMRGTSRADFQKGQVKRECISLHHSDHPHHHYDQLQKSSTHTQRLSNSQETEVISYVS